MAKKKKTALERFEREDPFNVRVTRDAMTRQTLIALGRFIADEICSRQLKLAVTVWTPNGQRLFAQAGEGTTGMNDLYMRRKFQTVLKFEMSTMALHWKLAGDMQTLTGRYALSESEYAPVGGGIPIYVNDLMVAIVTISGLPHVEDHKELVKMLHAFFDGGDW